MHVRYKILQFDCPIPVSLGDTFTAKLTEHDGTTHERSEQITEAFVVTHVCFFRMPGQGVGAIFGSDSMCQTVRSGGLFVQSTEIGENENL